MLKVLICDDEQNICRLIKNLVDWDTLNLEHVGMAKDGTEGLAMILTEKPDIVITDINMPNMTGLELIHEVITRGLDVRFVLVSGYAEFSYAHTAMKYGVSSFLLKPINQEELNDTLSSLSYQILESRGMDAMQHQYEVDMKDCQQKIRKYLVFRLSHYDSACETWNMDSLNREFFFRFQPGIWQGVILTCDSSSFQPAALTGIIEPQAKRIVQNLLEVCYDAEYVLQENAVLFLLNYSVEKRTSVRLILDYLLNTTTEVLNNYGLFYLTFSLGTAVTDPGMLIHSFYCASIGIERRLDDMLGTVIDSETLDCSRVSFDAEVLASEVSELEEQLDVRNPDVLLLHISTLWHENEGMLQTHPQFIKPFAVAWIDIFQKVLGNRFELGENELQKISQTKQVIQSAFRLTDIKEEINQCVSQVLQNLLENSDTADTKVLFLIKQYVQEHYAERIELKDVADEVFLSPSYLGIMFKKKTGMNFSDYVIDVRISMAKEFLRDVKYNVSEISDMIGYKDTRYFSKLFKKIVGVKPVEYRKIYHSFNRDLSVTDKDLG